MSLCKVGFLLDDSFSNYFLLFCRSLPFGVAFYFAIRKY
nr:MAG TPA: hypothetical protein [Bacteriophage sp.]